MGEEHSETPWDVDASAFPADGDVEAQARFLLRYAILAPSSHNSQPWEFAIEGDEVRVYADESRWLGVADADQRELYVSVGCAVENLLIAADHFGFATTVEYDHDPFVTTVTLRPGESAFAFPLDLFSAITDRRTNHEVYRDRPLQPGTFVRLARVVGRDGAEESVELDFVADAETKDEIAELQVRADERQFDDPAYRSELGHWIGSGALGATWLKARLGRLAVRHLDLGEREGQKNSTLIRSAPVVGVVATHDASASAQVSDARVNETRVDAGRAFERGWLLATSEGLAVHPMNQILQVPETRAELTDLLGASDRTFQLLFRMGYAPDESTRRPRRPLEAVLRE